MAKTETSATDESPKREAIMGAALELFAERGFHGTAVPLIADKAEVGAGTIYRYFDSKEALVNACYQRWKGELARTILEDFPFEAPEREQFRMWWRRMARFASQHPKAFDFLELHHHQPYLDDESRAIEMRVLTVAATFFEQGRKKKVTKELPTEVLMAIGYGAFVGLLKAKAAGFIDLTQDVLESAESCAWDAVSRD